MKNLKLNLKGLYGYRQSLLSRSPQPRDNREMSERRPSEERTLLATVPQRFARYAAMLIMLLTLGVGQMWGEYYIKHPFGGASDWSTKQMTWESGSTFTYVNYWGNAGANHGSTDETTNWWADISGKQNTWTTSTLVEFRWNGTTLSASEFTSTFPEGAILYLNVGSWNSTGNPYFAAYFFNSSSNSPQWVKMTQVGSSDYYYVAAPAGYSSVIFGRMNPSYPTPAWGDSHVWNNSIDLAYHSDKNTLNVSEWTANDYWSSYQEISTGSVTASSANTAVGANVTLTPELTSNTSYNVIKSTAYSVTTNPGSAGSVTSDGIFSATAAGTYIVTATITYNAKGYVGITETASSTVTITVADVHALTVSKDAGISTVTGGVVGINTSTDYPITATPKSGYTFAGWTTTDGFIITITNPEAATTASVHFKSDNNATVTATSTEDMTTANLIASPTGAGTFSDGSSSVTTVSAGVDTKPNVTAVPANGYYINTSSTVWTKDNNNISLSSTTALTTIVSGCGTSGTSSNLTATFTPVWWIKGSFNDWGETDELTFTTATTGYVEVNLTSGSSYTLKFYNKETNKWYTEASKTITRASYTATPSTEGGYDNEITITPDVTGTYRFTLTVSAGIPTALTVTFPTSYQVNYEVGTVKGASDDPSAEDNESNAISDGDLVLSGTEVTFTAADAADGYTWAGWYDAATTAGTKLSVGTAQTYTTTISAATTVYAVYTENLYTVTVSAGDHGSISVPAGGTVSAGADTKPTITASPNTNYAFKWWSNTDGNVTATDWNLASTTVSATAAGTLTANFFPQWALAGGDWNNTADDSDALGDWDTWTNGFEGFGTNASSEDTCIVSVTLPANTDFKFKIVDHRTGDWYGNSTSGVFKMTYADNNGKYWEGHVNSGSDEYQEFGLATAGAGSYKFAWNKTDKKAAVFFPTSYKVTFGYGTGGTSVSASVSGSGAGAIANNQYAASGSNITFSESHLNGYTFKGWYDAASGGSAVATMGKEDPILNSIAADASVYAQYTENMTTVTLANNGHGHVEIGGETVTSTTAGVTTTRSITAVPDAGYYFSGWTITEGTDFHLNGYAEANATATLTGNGDGETSGQTLTANFVELDKIYFRNIFDDGEGNVTRWESVYVHFDITWAEHDGKQAVQTSSDNISKGLHCSMTKIGTSDVYWAYVPRYITTNSKTSVAFADHDDSYNNSKLWEGNAAGRGDYNPLLNMFVPHHTKLYSTNSVDYYSNGYWMKYDTRASQGAGYYLKVYNSRNNYTEKGEFTANTDDATMIRFQVRVDNTNADKTRFMITSAGGLNYIADATVTSVSGAVEVSENLSTLTDNDVYFQLTATSEGYYTFILDQTGDEMKLSVDYPVAVGDYRLKHTYNDGSAHTTYSDIITSADAATGVIASMYLNTSNSPTFVLEKCTAVSPKIVWTQQGSDLWSAQRGNFNKGNGVYQFDITIAEGTTSTISDLSNAGLYEGDFYIKTDCAPGGWTSYKSNILDKNTVNFNESDASTFDYYHCNWAPSNTNVKCVIANDYNIQLTDTLKTDAILLACSPDATNHQSIPQNTSIRFSYNSKTNELKRAYLASVSGTDVSNVKIKPSTSEYVYQKDAATDLFSGANLKEAGNWTYQIDVDVYPGDDSQTKIETVYPTSGIGSATRELVGNTILLGSGSKGTNKYRVRLLYDFKTNKLTSAFIPSETIDATINLNTDYLYARVGEGSSTQLSFSEDGALNNVKKAYAAFEFPKDQMVGFMPDWTSNDYRARRYCRYYFSLPFAVRICDIFGVGEYGNQYIIQKYNGEKRAEIGWFQDTDTFWETLGDNEELEPNRGYALMLDREAFNDGSNGVWTNIQAGGSTFLYFPSKENVNTISGSTGSYPITAHMHTSNRVNSKTGEKHSDTDSNWAMIGANAYGDVYTQAGGRPAGRYEYNPATNGWTLNAGDKTDVYKSLHAYMVQWAGTFQWQTTTPASVAARQKDVVKNNTIQLNLIQNDEVSDKTFVKLNNEASTEFVLNEDVCKIINSGVPNIYTYAGVYDVALSQVPEENQIVSVGVVIRKNGKYTFSMPENINGTVTLIDEFEQTRTNLSLSDYEVTLPKGTTNDRFKLEINVKKIPTAIDGVEGEGTLKDGKAHKFLQNGVMYILQNGCLYDAQGRRVE